MMLDTHQTDVEGSNASPSEQSRQLVPYKRKRESENTQASTPEKRNGFTHHDYTIGWVCALDTEQAAAMVMLDEKHQDLSNRSNDDNAYTLGAIGKHNVVIACLPEGKVGNSQSASCIKAMVLAFPNIRIGLMVGIGGSMSSNVKLGDIMVSTPQGTFPGVVQWDMGKETKAGFQRTGSLDNPPNVVLTALKRLRALHKMRNEVKFPGYFKAALPKLEDDGDRPDGTQQRPRVHYGTIASGNSVIKAQARRDEIVESLGGDILCVEMEAAGIMSTFACLVIRGICDYSDETKNDDWHDYAALMAAAYTKDFLTAAVSPVHVESEEPYGKRMKLDSCES